ncbi:RHS repeat-associated core domain-containing protein [Nitrospirota bacterium]
MITYSANGNLTRFGDTTYTWNHSNRLVAVNTTTSYSTYTYDALNRRTSKTVDGVRTDYVYDGLDVVLELINNTPSAYYVRTRNIDQPLARVELNPDGTVERVGYYHADVQGSIIAVTDEDGAVIERYAYSPFGVTDIVLDDAEFDNPYYFTGKPWDVEAGLMYFNARYYSPEMGRFISVDPIGFEGGDWNLYRYTGNNPINFTDPLGLDTWSGAASNQSVFAGIFGVSVSYGSITNWSTGEKCDVAISSWSLGVGASVGLSVDALLINNGPSNSSELNGTSVSFGAAGGYGLYGSTSGSVGFSNNGTSQSGGVGFGAGGHMGAWVSTMEVISCECM